MAETPFNFKTYGILSNPKDSFAQIVPNYGF